MDFIDFMVQLSGIIAGFSIGLFFGVMLVKEELRKKKLIKGKFGIYSFTPYNSEVENQK